MNYSLILLRQFCRYEVNDVFDGTAGQGFNLCVLGAKYNLHSDLVTVCGIEL